MFLYLAHQLFRLKWDWEEHGKIGARSRQIVETLHDDGARRCLAYIGWGAMPSQDGDDDAESSMAWAQLALTWPAAVAANGTPSVPVTAIIRKCRIIYIIEITCVFAFIAPVIPA